MSKIPAQGWDGSSADKWRSGRGWGKISALACSPGTSSGARNRPPTGIKCREGANRGARSLSGTVLGPPLNAETE
jgi:hypothetical protein